MNSKVVLRALRYMKYSNPRSSVYTNDDFIAFENEIFDALQIKPQTVDIKNLSKKNAFPNPFLKLNKSKLSKGNIVIVKVLDDIYVNLYQEHRNSFKAYTSSIYLEFMDGLLKNYFRINNSHVLKFIRAYFKRFFVNAEGNKYVFDKIGQWANQTLGKFYEPLIKNAVAIDEKMSLFAIPKDVFENDQTWFKYLPKNFLSEDLLNNDSSEFLFNIIMEEKIKSPYSIVYVENPINSLASMRAKFNN